MEQTYKKYQVFIRTWFEEEDKQDQYQVFIIYKEYAQEAEETVRNFINENTEILRIDESRTDAG